MLVNENILRDALREAITDVTNTNIRPITVAEKQIKSTALKMFNITGGEMIYILNGRTPVDTMTDDMMFKISTVLFEFIKSNPSNFDVEKLNVDKYFADSEKLKYSEKINRKKVENDIICDYWIPIANDQIVVGMSNKQIAELISANRIHYNPETQRNLTEIKTENGVIKKVTFDSNAVNAIGEDMANGDYIPNTITFNINQDLYPQPYFKDGKFIIPKESIIDCINGFHRIKAATIISKLHPEVEFNFIVIIAGFDVAKAKKYIIQENYRVPLSEEQVTQDDKDDAANYVIDKLSNSLYFKNSNIKEMSYQLNKMLHRFFDLKRLKNSDAIQNALSIFKMIEGNMNNLIESNNLVGKTFTVEEWFIYLYLIEYTNGKNLDFCEFSSKINIEDLLRKISITKEPIKNHYKIMEGAVSNVQLR